MTGFQPTCPLCGGTHRQTKAGYAINGNKRYQCQDCKRYYVQENRRYRYPQEVRGKALEMHAAGMGYREIARELSVSHNTVANWISMASGNSEIPETGEHPSHARSDCGAHHAPP